MSPNPAGPLLSIVIPFYGVQDYLADALGSVRDQLLEDIEVVLIDDGSPDESLAIAEQFAAADPRFRVVRQHNQGLGPARNNGVAHATGRYLAFMDSDDLVPPRGYWHLVTSLEQSGSHIAAGNVWRFTTAGGVHQSWTHRSAFARARRAIDLAEAPELAADRMVWNKVYRRTFWDSHDFKFPAIRYEDYPVTLAAYLRAGTVDVVDEHVYLWRDRESGDSITQQAHVLNNAADRHTSAIQTLTVLDEYAAPPQVRFVVEASLAQVDLPALATTIAKAPAVDQPVAIAYASDLAHRLPIGASSAHSYAHLIHRALLHDTPDLAAAVAAARSGGGSPAVLRSAVRYHPKWLPLLMAELVRRPRLPRRSKRPLRSQLIKAAWDSNHYELTVRIALRHEFARSARVSTTVAGTHSQAESQPIDGGLLCTVRIDRSALEALPAGSHALAIDVRSGPMTWRGYPAGPEQAPAPIELPSHAEDHGHARIQLAACDEGTTLRKTHGAAAIESARVVNGSIELTLDAPAEPVVTLRRPEPSGDVHVPLSDRVAVLDPATALLGDPPDDVVSGVAARRLECSGPLLLIDGPRVRVVLKDLELEDLELELGRDETGAAVLRRRPL